MAPRFLVALALALALLPTPALADSCAKWENEVYVRDAVADTVSTQILRTGGPFSCYFAPTLWLSPNRWHNLCAPSELDKAAAKAVAGGWVTNFAATAEVNAAGRIADAVFFRHTRALCGQVYKAVDKLYAGVLLNNGIIIGGQVAYRFNIK
jgi:hypothetical protein